jgi:hypothetical protein
MFIPNGSTLKYKYHQVPAEKTSNNLFGDIENRISQGFLDPAEIYLWALKIHIGCIYRDASLRFDIKDPSSPSILHITDFGQEAWLFRQLFDVWSHKGTTTPSPFGSVFIVESLVSPHQFDFMHCLITGVVAIDIGGKLIVAFLWDQGDATRSTNVLKQWEEWHAPRVKSLKGNPDYEANCSLAAHVWACESAYWLYRHRRPYNMIKAHNQIVLVPSVSRTKGKPSDESQYRQVCRNFGLELVQYNGEVNNVYRQFDPSEITPTPTASP